MSENKESTMTQSNLSSEQALDDYFTALLGDGTLDCDVFFVDEFSENTVSNFFLPYGVVPNVMINHELYCVPMVIEESSVVAACAKSAKFWRVKRNKRSSGSN